MKKIIVMLFIFLPVLSIAETNFERGEKARIGQNWDLAVSEYEKAVIEGHPLAAHWLGVFYYHGEGVKQSYQHAVAYFYIAANQGVEGSMVYLANIHVSGKGVDKDCDKAESWVFKFTKGDIPKDWGVILAKCRETSE